MKTSATNAHKADKGSVRRSIHTERIVWTKLLQTTLRVTVFSICPPPRLPPARVQLCSMHTHAIRLFSVLSDGNRIIKFDASVWHLCAAQRLFCMERITPPAKTSGCARAHRCRQLCRRWRHDVSSKHTTVLAVRREGYYTQQHC